jgi:hypothetical protein
MLLYEKKNEEVLLIKSEVLKRTRYEGEKMRNILVAITFGSTYHFFTVKYRKKNSEVLSICLQARK